MKFTTTKQFLTATLVALILVLAGLLISTNKSTPAKDISDQSSINQVNQDIKTNDDTKLILGQDDADSTIIEYLDYKCPACNSFHRTTFQEIESEYITNGLTNIELRLTPIIGPDSATAARGAYCANEQDLFSEYHTSVLNHMWDNYYGKGDLSIEFENYLSSARLSTILKETSVDIDSGQFIECTDSDKYNPLLDENLLKAAEDSVQGTPGFAIGDQSFVGGQPFSVFKQLLEIQLR